MKAIYKSSLKLFSLSILLLAGSCTTVDFDEVAESAQKSSLKVMTRSSNAEELNYPVIIYAFNETGKLETKQTLSSSGESLSLALNEGLYHLVALSDFSDYSIPQNISYESFISMPDTKYSSSALRMGAADVNLKSGSQTSNISLSYAVSSVCLSLSDVPSDVKSVAVTLSNLNTKKSFRGTESGSETISVNCKKENGNWTTGNFYVFGNGSNSLVISISLTSSDGTETYGYTYNASLKPGVPYQFIGSYTEGLSVNGSIDFGDWEDAVVAEFNFGPGSSSKKSAKTEHVSVSSIPEANTLWKDHVVAGVQNQTDTEADLILLSLNEWADMTSANHATNPDAAQTLADSYVEADMENWNIPTREQAAYLKGLYYNESFSSLNATIESAGGVALSVEDEKGANVRYLCENATYTFVFKNNSSITKAGATVSTYRLRLVKVVHVSTE